MNDSIVELIETIKARPAMFLGRNYISCLKAFLDGWYHRNATGVFDALFMDDFQSWIEKKYEVKSNHSWCDILLFYSGDECKALQNFFREFDEFKIYRTTISAE